MSVLERSKEHVRSGGARRARELDEEHEPRAARPLTPGKLTRDEAAALPRRGVAPGRLRASDAADDASMTAADALAFADALLRVDRKAEPGADQVDGGAFATAFSFVDTSQGQPLPAELRRQLERELDIDLSRVRVHTGAAAATAATALGARAFTIGDDIFFAADAYDPRSEDGVRLIAHEVTHVAQRARTPGEPGVSRAGDPDEHHADATAHAFVGRKTWRLDPSDPASIVEHVRRAGEKLDLPFRRELEEHFGQQFDFLEAYTGEAAQLACQLLAAGAFAVRNVVAFADPSPRREQLMHELAHVVQMGGRLGRAPARFEKGSLAVGDHDSAAEGDARDVALGASVGVRAGGDVIHRDPPGSSGSGSSGPAWTIDDAAARFQTYIGSRKRGAADRFAFATPRAQFWRLYSDTLREPFRLDQYFRTVGGTLPREVVRRDLEQLHARRSDVGIVRVDRLPPEGDDEGTDGRRWTYVNPSESPSAPVVYVHDAVRRAPNWDEAWNSYCRAAQHLHGRGSIQSFTAVTFGGQTYALQPSLRTGYTEDECRELRHQLVAAIVAEPKYQWQPATYWTTFRTEVAPSGLQQAIIGDAFSQIARANLAAAGCPFTDAETFFFDTRLTSPSKWRRADGFATQGERIVIDCKNGGSAPGAPADTDRTTTQARDYARIIRHRIEAHSPPQVEGTSFTQCAYIFSTPELARQWAPQLAAIFRAETLNPDDTLIIFPPVDGYATLDVQVNPTFQVALRDRHATHHRLVEPIIHPGINVREMQLQTRTPGGVDLVSGSATMDVDMGGAVQGERVTKPITPEAAGTGAPRARMENGLPRLRTGLDRIFRRLETDARLTDEGVEATIRVTAGPSGVPNLNLQDATLTVRYANSGDLSVTGTIGVAHTSGRISGRVTVGYTGGQWTFSGQATVAAGLVEGLSEFTARVAYEDGRWRFGVDQVEYTKRVGAVTLTGTAYGVEYDVERGDFSGNVNLTADLGMFGRASAEATLEHNRLAQASLSYDSPELKYPPNSATPVVAGTVGGTLTYRNGHLAGSIRGNGRLNIPGLSAIAGESGLGLAVEANVNDEGNYSGSIRTTTPLRFGDHFEIPSLACTINEDGSVAGDFAVRVVNFRYLERAQIDCRIDAEGFHVTRADVRVPFGTENESRFWGALEVGYQEGRGLQITGDVHMKVKEGMIANGHLTYSTETNQVDLRLGIDEIRILEYGPQRRNLFHFARQIPIASFYNLIGIYLDLGFDLDFEYELRLGLRPTITLEGLSMDTWEYTRAAAEIELLGLLAARLIATPRVGLGLFAISPSLLRGGGGLQVPITGEAVLRPTGRLAVSYTPSGGVEGEASVGMALTFGIRGAVRPYAEASVLDGAWNPTWTGDALTEFEIMPPKELFNFQLDLAGDMSQREPEIPSSPQAPAASTAGRQIAQEDSTPRDVGTPSPGREATPPSSMPAGGEGGASDDVFNISSLLGGLRGLPGYAALSGFMERAGRVWEQIRGFFGRVAGAFRSFFETMANEIDAILDGFASQGLAYLPQLIRRIVGPTVWEVIEPIVDAVAGTAEQILELFETSPPAGLEDFFPWALRLARRAFGIGFNGITELVSAIRTMMGRLSGTARRLVTHMVQEGMIGVRRHAYYIWRPWPMDDYNFLAATEYKIHILGFDVDFRDEGMITDPGSVVGVALFEVLEALGVPSTNDTFDRDAGDSYRDRWA